MTKVILVRPLKGGTASGVGLLQYVYYTKFLNINALNLSFVLNENAFFSKSEKLRFYQPNRNAVVRIQALQASQFCKAAAFRLPAPSRK